MKKYYTTVSEDGYTNNIFVCELTANDVTKAEKEYQLYMQSKGETYDLDINKYPNIRNFFKLFFGECEADIYCGECWITPNRYICADKILADSFMKLVGQLAYHNAYRQEFCVVEQNGNIIDVIYGDY